MVWPRQDRASMNAFYGDPAARGMGVADRMWEDANLTVLSPPYRMVLAWAPETAVTKIHCHKKVVDSLARVLHGIANHYGSQAAVETANMHLFGGCYAFRPMRGSAQLSVHSWGAAIDLDPSHNPFGGEPTMDPAVVDIFRGEGWTWGGEWHGRMQDGMHFQAAHL